jgi:hypothetical protein
MGYLKSVTGFFCEVIWVNSSLSMMCTILERAWSANFKILWYVLLRPLRPELNGQDQIHFKFVEACVKLEKRRL